MYIFKIHGKEYKVRFTYRTVCEGDILDKISDATDFEGLGIRGMIEKISKATAELLLVGLQKYHSKEFGYSTDEEKAQRIEEMLDLFDDYEDESTEEHEQSAATLFTDLQGELQKNGFLSAMMTAVEETSKAAQTMENTKTEMANEAARVVAMNPIESES